MVRFLLALVIVGLFSYSGLRSWRWWWAYRDPRSLRNFLNGLALLAGAIVLVAMTYTLDFAPEQTEAALEVATWAGLTVLLAVGVADVVSWRWPTNG